MEGAEVGIGSGGKAGCESECRALAYAKHAGTVVSGEASSGRIGPVVVPVDGKLVRNVAAGKDDRDRVSLIDRYHRVRSVPATEYTDKVD